MCGICGIVRFDSRPIDATELAHASAALRHRGPDAAGAWTDPARSSAGFAAARLSVIDPRTIANQPLHSGDGRYHLVFNGELYNFREIRHELSAAGVRFVTENDAEVVLHACAMWGTDALRRLNGMWAFAFYDSVERTGFLCRDRFGIKPLFYAADGRAIRFASELGSLCRFEDWDRDVDPSAVSELLQFGYISHPSSIYAVAKRLPPGHFLRFDAKSAESSAFYYKWPTTTKSERELPYGEACESLRTILADAIVSQRVSDVPIGAFLSGGVDSSIVVARLASASARPIQTFSIGYANQPAYDESGPAREVARVFGTDHHEIILSESDVLDVLPGVLDHLHEPVGDSSILPTSLVSRFARSWVTVALGGDGSDELFGGYWRYLGHASLAAYRRAPGWIRKHLIAPLLGMATASKGTAFGNRSRQFQKLLRGDVDDPFLRHILWSRLATPEEPSLFNDSRWETEATRRFLFRIGAEAGGADGADPLRAILRFDLAVPLPCDMLQKVDLASMMHSLEVRVPFLDHRLVEFALSLPTSYKIDRGMRKRILLDAHQEILPDFVLDRAKQGFEVPVGEFFRGALRESFHDIVNRATVEQLGIVSYDAVEAAFRDHFERRSEHADLLFALYSLCWWLRRRRI